MSHPITLTNVFIGIHKHDLINILTPGCFTFYTGLILCANSLHFKNPIGMSSKQAMAAGGGDSRQTVYSRRKTLCKIRIDGDPILKCKPGSHAKNSVALYEINYNLLCRYNGVWSESTDVMLNENYSKATDSLQIANGKATILRSDQKREEEKKEEKPLSSTSDEEKKKQWQDKILAVHGKPHWNTELVSATYQLSIKIREAFGGDCCLAHEGDTQLILMQLMAYDEAKVLAVAGDRNSPGRTSQGIEWVLDNVEGREDDC